MEKKRNDVINEEFGLVNKVRNPKIETFSVRYLERRKHIRSYKRDALFVRILLRFFRGNNLASINASNIEDYINEIKSTGVANATINKELTCLKRMFNLAIKWKETRHNPVNDIDFLEEPPGRIRFLSIDEAKELIQNAMIILNPL